ncbi:uncharacterized protein LOC128671294 isoform X2 [Plodia interpunctella]|uniref:uncharacterized protein LOC128671294 isoform X2 n=1 Tax=Plodia interpunctella TaxID=58824 RepID=UPI002368912B|nr:uncharacterized protein LOC128671294 isoform X2 [Plodia interpunctella]
MFAKATVIACIIGLARSGAIHNSATHLGQYGNLGAYGQHRLAGNLRYAGNPANADEAVSYVNIVREISNRGGYTNGSNPQAGVAAYGGVTASYSNIYNSPLRSPLLGNGAYGIGAAAGYGYGNGYGHGQAW